MSKPQITPETLLKQHDELREAMLNVIAQHAGRSFRDNVKDDGDVLYTDKCVYTEQYYGDQGAPVSGKLIEIDLSGNYITVYLEDEFVSDEFELVSQTTDVLAAILRLL